MERKTKIQLKYLFIYISHSFRRIVNHIKISILLFYRSKFTIFLFIIFPIIILLLFGSIFGESKNLSYHLEVQNKDNSVDADEFLQILESNNILDIHYLEESIDPKAYLFEKNLQACLIIPNDWYANTLIYPKSNVTLIINPFSPSALRIASIVEKSLYNFNIIKNNTSPLVNIKLESFSSGLNYIDFLLPGIIGIIIMNTGILGTISRQSYFKKTSLHKKFATTPLTRWEYTTAEILWQFLLAFISTILAIFVAWFVFDYSWISFNAMILPIVFIGVVLFAGLGLLISQLIRNVTNSLTIGSLVTIPMLFLSGIFFDMSKSTALIVISKFSPLTFIVNALRSSMITSNFNDAWINLSIAFTIGIISIIIGIFLTRWERD